LQLVEHDDGIECDLPDVLAPLVDRDGLRRA
jgi:hypothetical protein